MLEIRPRVLDVRERDTEPPSCFGIVEGVSEILVHARTLGQAERDLENPFEEYLRRLTDYSAMRIPLDDFPTVRVIKGRLKQ